MIIFGLALSVAMGVAWLLSFSRFARSASWRATVSPLASIIGSGFLVCGPLMAREFGEFSILAMAALLALAYAVGAVVRFNIRHAEPLLADIGPRDPISWLARTGQVVLGLAYAVSVAYYLRLLAEFTLKSVARSHDLWATGLVTMLVACLALLASVGGLRRVEQLAHGAVSLKIGIVAGMLTALGIYWVLHASVPIYLPRAPLSLHSATVLLGLLVTVQGFEISRYLGQSYPADMRIRTMRNAQWISAVIYLAFILLLTPFLDLASRTQGVAGILDVMRSVAWGLTVLVLFGAGFSQLSAAVADSIGSAGLLSEVSRNRLRFKAAFILSGSLAVGVAWLTDPFQVIALASRAFALFYAIQCVLALAVSVRTRTGGLPARLGFLSVATICLVAMLAGAPAE